MRRHLAARGPSGWRRRTEHLGDLLLPVDVVDDDPVVGMEEAEAVPDECPGLARQPLAQAFSEPELALLDEDGLVLMGQCLAKCLRRSNNLALSAPPR